ncbi:hypothetical protein [Stakelama tenebrarum]|uniref:DUF3168 domain-containing protein n=1 Tax=Stakelama tenebrarum TaxID=2711215 RepID=A0A6G6Y5W1_9SPHN|nr:hypothetical protein [Sphingosinithalassobacter tenebrarum]QIG80108.1 hypothetical protein G5C33_10170 [Sphingosinithalassobacter tenebrarum]
MSFETAVSARFLADADMTAAIGGRVNWQVRAQGNPLPDITLDIVSDARPQHFKGFERVRPTRVQVTVRAADPASAVRLRDLAIEILVPPAIADGVKFQRAQDVQVRTGFEPGPTEDAFGQILDLILIHNG